MPTRFFLHKQAIYKCVFQLSFLLEGKQGQLSSSYSRGLENEKYAAISFTYCLLLFFPFPTIPNPGYILYVASWGNIFLVPVTSNCSSNSLQVTSHHANSQYPFFYQIYKQKKHLETKHLSAVKRLNIFRRNKMY